MAGAVKLGSAGLGIFGDCDQAVETKYTIVTGSSSKGTFNGLANGAILRAGGDGSAACQADGSVGPSLEITYSATAVTATVVATPPAAASHASAASAPVAHERSNGVIRNEG